MKNLIIFSSLFLIFHLPTFAQFGGGDGLTEATAFQIYTKAHLEELADSAVWNMNPNFTTGKYFKLMNDITDTVTIPIPYFMGTFDGQNYTIALNIQFLVNDIGLFRHIKNATIKNLRTTGYVRGDFVVAGIAARATNSFVSNCHNSAFVIANGALGGIAGLMVENSIVTHCFNIGTIEIAGQNSNHPNAKPEGRIGGIVGVTDTSATVTNCFNAGFIKNKILYVGGISSVGGIVGRGLGNISNNINVGVIMQCHENAHCIVGYADDDTVLENNYYDKQMCVCCEDE